MNLLVGFAMPPNLHRIALFFYNFTSILGLTFKNQTYEVSKFQTFSSFLRMTAVTICFLIFTFFDVRGVFHEIVLIKKNFSKFASFAYDFGVFLDNFFSYVLFFFLVSHRKEANSFMNSAVNIWLAQKYLEKFKVRSVKSFLSINIFYSVVFTFEFLGSCKFSIFNFGIFLIMTYPMLLGISFVGFVKHYDIFVVCSLKDFKHDLKKYLKRGKCDHEKFEELSSKYQKIYDLAEHFNRGFGPPVTFFICVNFLASIFNVDLWSSKLNRIWIFLILSVI